MSRDPQAAGLVGSALGKGCLAGVGVALLFFVLSLLVYLLIGPFGLPPNVRLLITFASGPILGTGVVLVVFWAFVRRPPQGE